MEYMIWIMNKSVKKLFEVTTSGSHTDSQFATALLMCSCGSSTEMVCKATFNSSVVLQGLQLQFMVLSSMAPQAGSHPQGLWGH